MKKMRPIYLLLLASLLSLSSCAKKEFLYLSDMVDEAGYVVANRHQSRIQSDDRLKITVTCKNPELAAPFNVSSGAVTVSANGTVSTPAAGGLDSYRVNADGDINFPVLGTIHVAGRSLQECSELIRDLIISGSYIKDPIVTTEFLNFHYTVLGAVSGNGTFAVDGDKVTILEAIAKSGDLSANADLERIAVIREVDGQRRLYNLDIRSTDIFNSPAFYLAQNDIVYVRPKGPKSTDSGKYMQWITIALSAVTAACSVVWATRR